MTNNKTVTFDATLLPCPFCGGSDLEIANTHTASFWVACNNCDAKAHGEYVKGPERDDKFHYQAFPDDSGLEAAYDDLHPEYQRSFRSAVDAWNTRAPTPAAQSAGQEPIRQVKWHEGDGWVDVDRETFAEYADRALHKRFVYAAPVNGGERELGQVIDERDQYHDAAEKLADAIAKHFGVEIGEHSNLNCPWQNALDHIAQATKRAADAQQVGATNARLVRALEEIVKNDPFNQSSAGIIARAALTSPAKVGVQPAHEQNARFAIDGAISLGMQGVKQPDADHWLAKYWDIGRQLAAKVPDAVMRALDRMSTPLHDSRLSGLTAELDAANIKTIRDYVLSGAVPAKVVGDDQHPDDTAVDRFSVAMKAKLAKKRAQGRGGWDDERVCSPDDLARMLVDHVRKGDPVDVGNLAMMLFNRPDTGAALCRAALSADGGEDKRALDAALNEAYQMVDLMKPPPAGSYLRGEHEGIVAALKTVRASFDAAIAANQARKGDA